MSWNLPAFFPLGHIHISDATTVILPLTLEKQHMLSHHQLSIVKSTIEINILVTCVSGTSLRRQLIIFRQLQWNETCIWFFPVVG